MSKKKPKVTDVKQMEAEYNALSPLMERFAKELVNQVETLVDREGVALGFPVQYRVKDWHSLEVKFQRLNRQFKSIKDVQDLVGLRIILLFQRDADRISKLIDGNFSVDRKYDTAERLHEDQFGYSSIHYVVSLPQEWLAVPTLSGLEGFKGEIQIRTLAQHMWAEASHRLQYKHEENVPPTVQRAISRVSALLETVDLEFERVLTEREHYRSNADISGTGELLNVDLLETTMDSLLPVENKVEQEPYDELLKELFYLGVRTQQQLREMIEECQETVLEKDLKKVRDMVALYEKTGKPGSEMSSRLRKGVFASQSNLIREMLITRYGKQYFEYLRQNVNKPTEEKQ